MFNRYLTYYSPGVQLLIFCILFLISLFINEMIGNLIFQKLSNGSNLSVLSDNSTYNNAQLVRSAKWIQLISQLFIFILPAALFAYLAYPKPKDYLHLQLPIVKKHWFLAFFLIVLSIPFFSFLEYLNKMIPLPDSVLVVEKFAMLVTDSFLADKDFTGIFLNIGMFVVLAAIGEELFFRSVIQNIIISHWYKKNPWVGIIITAIIFSLFHGQMQGFFPRFMAGVVIGGAYYYSGSILIAIMMHAINNGLSLVSYYAEKGNYYSENDIQQAYLIVFGIATFYFLYLMFRCKSDYVVHKVPQDPNETHFLANKY